jgi:hypothetical protein
MTLDKTNGFREHARSGGDKLCNGDTMALPNDPDAILPEHGVDGDERQILRLRLRNQHSVKRIAMWARQVSCALRVVDGDGQLGEALTSKTSRHVRGYGCGAGQFA